MNKIEQRIAERIFGEIWSKWFDETGTQLQLSNKFIEEVVLESMHAYKNHVDESENRLVDATIIKAVEEAKKQWYIKLYKKLTLIYIDKTLDIQNYFYEIESKIVGNDKH